MGELITLDDTTSHHLLRVTGIGPSERVEIFDGQGVAAEAVLVDVNDGCAVLKVVQLKPLLPTACRVHVLLAQTRANVLDTTLRMLTELGVASIRVVTTERCVAKGDKSSRWRRIVESASAQCGRTTLPVLEVPCSFTKALKEGRGERFVFVPGSEQVTPPLGEVSLLIGPEGGLSDDEINHAQAEGWQQAGLSETVLRADTAAVVAVARFSR